MTKLRYHAHDDDPDTLLFPGVKRAPVRETTKPQPPTTDAIRMVEDAMHDAQMKFDRLRKMLGYTDDDDRPRAA